MNKTIAKIYVGGEKLFARSLAGQAGFTAARFLPMFSERSLCRIASTINQMPPEKRIRAGDNIIGLKTSAEFSIWEETTKCLSSAIT